MKRTIILLLAMLCLGTISAQNIEKKSKKISTDSTEKPLVVRDRLVFDIYHSFWMNTPKQGNFKKFNPGFNVSAMWDFRLPQNKSLSFGLGVGFTYYTQYSDCIIQYNKTEDLTKYYILPEDLDYKYSRVSYMNCNIPFEIRYRHRSGFKIDLGVHVGLVAGFAHRYKGDNYQDADAEYLNFKNRDFYNKQKFSADVFLRMGWKGFGVYYSYQLNKIFETGKGPAMNPMSLGISIALF